MFLEVINQSLIMHEMGGLCTETQVFNIPEEFEIGVITSSIPTLMSRYSDIALFSFSACTRHAAI